MMKPDSTDIAWLANTLTRQIPLGDAMSLSIANLDEDGLILALPLAPNINDKGTAFGGAMASAMILAGWSLPRLLMRQAGIQAELVIGRCEMRFLRPVNGPFEARCHWPEPAASERFLADIESRGRGRLDLTPGIYFKGEVAATLSARYAALTGL